MSTRKILRRMARAKMEKAGAVHLNDKRGKTSFFAQEWRKAVNGYSVPKKIGNGKNKGTTRVYNVRFVPGAFDLAIYGRKKHRGKVVRSEVS